MNLEKFVIICQAELKCLRTYIQQITTQTLVEQKQEEVLIGLIKILYSMLTTQSQQLFLSKLDILKPIIQSKSEVLVQTAEEVPCNIFDDSLLISKTDQQFMRNSINLPNFSTTLLYRGSRDGFSTDEFYRLCSEKGSTVTVIKSKEQQKIFGGYASLSWKIPKTGWINFKDTNAFIFSLTHQTKHILYQDYDNALCMYKSSIEQRAPCFGGKGDFIYDIIISDKCNLDATSQSDLGKNYQLLPGQTMEEGKTYLAGSHKFTVEEIEVYQIFQM